MNITKSENSLDNKPCLYEGIIYSIDHETQTGQADIGLGRGLVGIEFRYVGQHWIWNMDAYPGDDPGQFGSHAFCIDDVALLIYERNSETEEEKYTAVAVLKSNRTEIDKRWCWPLYPRDEVVIAKITYTNDANKSYGFPFIKDDGTRELINPFTDQEGNERALGTLDGPENYMVLRRRSNGDYIPHAAHEFMNQFDRFTFVPDISGRTIPNFTGRVVGVSYYQQLLIDNIPFINMGNHTASGQPHSDHPATRRYVSISNDGNVTVYVVTVDLNAIQNSGIKAVNYPFEVAKGTTNVPVCIYEIMAQPSLETVDMTVDLALSIAKYATAPAPWGYEPDIGWYDNLSSMLVIIDKSDTKTFDYIWAHQLSNLTALDDIFVHHQYTFISDQYGNVSTSFNYMTFDYGVHQRFPRIIGTRSLSPSSPATSDPRTETAAVTGSIARGTAKAKISEDGDYTLDADYEETVNHSKVIHGSYDSTYGIYKDAESGNVNSWYKIPYIWNNMEICSHYVKLSSTYNLSFTLNTETDPPTAWLTQSGTGSSALTVELIVFLHVDIKNGIFVYLRCCINNAVDVESMYNNGSSYYYPSPSNIKYELYIFNRGAKTLLNTWNMVAPTGYRPSWSTIQEDNHQAFNWFRDNLVGVSYWPDPTLAHTVKYWACELKSPTEALYDDSDPTWPIHRLWGSATGVGHFDGQLFGSDRVFGVELNGDNHAYANKPCPNIDVSYIAKFWHELQYDRTEFSLHPFADRENKWPTPRCIAAPLYPYWEDAHHLESPFHNWIMMANGYITRNGASSTGAYKFSYEFNIGGYTDTVVVEHADMGKIESCTGRADAVITLT